MNPVDEELQQRNAELWDRARKGIGAGWVPMQNWPGTADEAQAWTVARNAGKGTIVLDRSASFELKRVGFAAAIQRAEELNQAAETAAEEGAK